MDGAPWGLRSSQTRKLLSVKEAGRFFSLRSLVEGEKIHLRSHCDNVDNNSRITRDDHDEVGQTSSLRGGGFLWI